MKYAFLAVTALLLVSCNNGGADVATKQHIIDSLVKLVPGGSILHNDEVVNTAATYTIAPVSNYYIPKASADTLIQNYHALFGSTKNPKDAVISRASNMGRTAFLIPANTLAKLINEHGNPWVVFYLGYDKPTSSICLVYDGAKYVGNRQDTLTEDIMVDPTQPGIPMVFDNSIPCPKCTGIGVHTAMGPFNSNIYASVGPNGSTIPSGNIIPVQYGSDQMVQLKPAQGFVVDQLIVNGTPYPDSAAAQHYTFINVKATKTMTVTFKPQGPQ